MSIVIKPPTKEYEDNYVKIFGDNSASNYKRSDRPKEELHDLNINTESWIEGWYEHIGPNPVKIEDRKHLLRECNRQGVIPKALTGPKSRGKGIEIKGRR